MAWPPVTALLTTDTIHMLHEFKVVNRKMEIFSVKIFSRLFPGDFARMSWRKPRAGQPRGAEAGGTEERGAIAPSTCGPSTCGQLAKRA
jgi:hypothetical protein